jgi:hypothetical protein
MAIHYAIESHWPWSDVNAACGHNFRRSKRLTDDPAKVTCARCIALCGFDHLTECCGDPLLKRRAA